MREEGKHHKATYHDQTGLEVTGVRHKACAVIQAGAICECCVLGVEG